MKKISSIILCLFIPVSANANPLIGVVDFINNGLVRIIAILIVAGLITCSWYGKISWKLTQQITTGAILIFGSSAAVDYMISFF